MRHVSRPLALALFLLASAAPASGQVARLLRDIDPGLSEGAANGASSPSQLTAMGDKVAFVANGEEIWFADATTGRAAPVADLCPQQCHLAPMILATRAGRLFFYANGSMWASDGTAAGTFALPDPSVGARAAFLEFADFVANLPQALLFAAGHPDGSFRLWRTDGTPEGTAEIATLAAPGEPPSFRAARALGSRAVFVLHRQSTSTLELWSSDGTAAGQRAIPPLVIQGSSEQVWRTTATHFFFTAVTGGQGEELWASDGTAAGTRAVSSFAAPNPFWLDAMKKPLRQVPLLPGRRHHARRRAVAQRRHAPGDDAHHRLRLLRSLRGLEPGEPGLARRGRRQGGVLRHRRVRAAAAVDERRLADLGEEAPRAVYRRMHGRRRRVAPADGESSLLRRLRRGKRYGAVVDRRHHRRHQAGARHLPRTVPLVAEECVA